MDKVIHSGQEDFQGPLNKIDSNFLFCIENQYIQSVVTNLRDLLLQDEEREQNDQIILLSKVRSEICHDKKLYREELELSSYE